MNRPKRPGASAPESSSISATAQAVPNSMKGMRLPRRVLVRSDSLPNSGSRNRASTLSAAMIAPETLSPMWKVSRRISGMMVSYICQKAQIEKNASPISSVRRVFSFMAGPPEGVICLYYSSGRGIRQGGCYRTMSPKR